MPSSGDSWLETADTCCDPDKLERQSDSLWNTYIGNVHQEPHGPQREAWVWSMTAVLPGPRFPFPTNGKEVKRSDAGRQVVECFEHMLRFYDGLQIQVRPAHQTRWTSPAITAAELMRFLASADAIETVMSIWLDPITRR